MKIIINEMKKLLNIKSLMILGVIFLVGWKMFVSFEIEVFPNGSHKYPFELSERMLAEYGTEVDKSEMDDFKADTVLLEKELDNYIANDSEAKDIGITTYKEYNDEYNKVFTKGLKTKVEELHSKYMFGENIAEQEKFYEMESREFSIKEYDEGWKLTDSSFKQKEIDRINELMLNGEIYSPMSYVVKKNYDNLMGSFSILIILSVGFIISPIFLSDKNKNINYLQYGSKIGRKLVKKKIIAGLISTIIIVTAEISFLFIMFAGNDTLKFWNCSINSLWGGGLSWFSLTFGEYIILTVILMYIIALVTTCISMFVSSRVLTNISLIAVQVPILGIIIAFLKSYGMGMVGIIYLPKYLLGVSYIIFIVIAVVLIVKLIKNENKRDILN